MASNINMVVIEGNLGKDADTRYTNNNKSVTSFSIAVNKSYKDQSGNWQDKTSWIPVVKWNASDYAKDQLKKGQSVTISGELVQESWEKDGERKSRTYVNADKISYHKKLESNGGNDYEADSSTGRNENDDLPF